MIAPRYQDIAPASIPSTSIEGADVRIVSGKVQGLVGPVQRIDVEPLFLDVSLARGSSFRTMIPSGHSAFAYVTNGAARFGGSRTEARRGQLVVLGRGRASVAPVTGGTEDLVSIHSDATTARVLLFAARPLGEPVARGGPFVMSTQDELKQAWDDYRSGRLVNGT